MLRDAKDASLEKFTNDSTVRILLCSLKCGSLGLNLTVASQVIFFDMFWNPQVHEQAIDRVYRIGQTRDVVVYELIAKDTAEEQIVKLQDKKRDMAKKVLSSGSRGGKTKGGMSSISKDEMLKLMSLRAKRN